jgi:hypothetical protein
MNLAALISVVVVSIAVTNFATLSLPVAIGISAAVYALLFHYLLVMVYLMRYLYLLVIGGAFEEAETRQPQESEPEAEENEITV